MRKIARGDAKLKNEEVKRENVRTSDIINRKEKEDA